MYQERTNLKTACEDSKDGSRAISRILTTTHLVWKYVARTFSSNRWYSKSQREQTEDYGGQNTHLGMGVVPRVLKWVRRMFQWAMMGVVDSGRTQEAR